MSTKEKNKKEIPTKASDDVKNGVKSKKTSSMTPVEVLAMSDKIPREKVKKLLNEMRDNRLLKHEARGEYTARKAHVALMKKMNYDKIIVFESVDRPWHKIGWHSALFYAYDVALQVCKKKDLPTIRNDTDLGTRSDDGIVFVRSLEKSLSGW